MSSILRLAIVDPQDASRERLRSLLATLDGAWLVGESTRYENFAELVGQTHPHVGFVSLDQDPNAAIRLIQRLRHEHPDCRLLALGNTQDGSLILRVVRAGVRDFLPRTPGSGEVGEALDRIRDEIFGANAPTTNGCSVIVVAGATGGVGATNLAVNLACTLASVPQRNVALVDLDLALGDADVLLDVIPEYTLADVTQNIGRLDLSLLKRSLTKHASGLYLLPRPIRLQETALIAADEFQRVLSLLKATFTHLVIDISKGYTPLDLAALQTAQHVLLVTQLDLPCLRNVVRLLLSFEAIDGLKERVKIIVNRVGLEHQHISLKKAQETMGRPIYDQLPNDYASVVEARNNGVPLVVQSPQAPITQAVVRLAEKLCGGPVYQPASTTESSWTHWLAFWRGGSKATGAASSSGSSS